MDNAFTTHIKDQFGAAATDGRRVMVETAGREGLAIGWHAPAHDWIAQQGIKIYAGIKDGTLARCPHLGSPALTFMSAWRMDMLRCAECFDRQEPLGGDAEMTCDRCGLIDPAGLFPGCVLLGVVIFSYGLCGECNAQLHEGATSWCPAGSNPVTSKPVTSPTKPKGQR